MISLSPPLRLGFTATYTLWMCARALRDVALGAPPGRVRELTASWAVGLSTHTGIEVRAFGDTALDFSTPFILMANHQSYLDVFALYRALPIRFGFVAKKQLFAWPLFGGVMNALGCVPIDRDDRSQAVNALDEAAAKIRAGAPIAVFPEGTRSPPGVISTMKKGPFYLAQRAGVPVLPVGIRGTAALMPRRNTEVRPGVLEVHVGTLLPPIASEGAEARQALMNRVRVELARLADMPLGD